jgi:hypothetical protein
MQSNYHHERTQYVGTGVFTMATTDPATGTGAFLNKEAVATDFALTGILASTPAIGLRLPGVYLV